MAGCGPAGGARPTGLVVAFDDKCPMLKATVYYVTADCQLRSLDTQGFGDGENDGPYRQEVFEDKGAADIVWELDMPALGVFPHEACNSDVLPLGGLLIVGTPTARMKAIRASHRRVRQV